MSQIEYEAELLASLRAKLNVGDPDLFLVNVSSHSGMTTLDWRPHPMVPFRPLPTKGPLNEHASLMCRLDGQAPDWTATQDRFREHAQRINDLLQCATAPGTGPLNQSLNVNHTAESKFLNMLQAAQSYASGIAGCPVPAIHCVQSWLHNECAYEAEDVDAVRHLASSITLKEADGSVFTDADGELEARNSSRPQVRFNRERIWVKPQSTEVLGPLRLILRRAETRDDALGLVRFQGFLSTPDFVVPDNAVLGFPENHDANVAAILWRIYAHHYAKLRAFSAAQRSLVSDMKQVSDKTDISQGITYRVLAQVRTYAELKLIGEHHRKADDSAFLAKNQEHLDLPLI